MPDFASLVYRLRGAALCFFFAFKRGQGKQGDDEHDDPEGEHLTIVVKRPTVEANSCDTADKAKDGCGVATHGVWRP